MSPCVSLQHIHNCRIRAIMRHQIETYCTPGLQWSATGVTHRALRETFPSLWVSTVHRLQKSPTLTQAQTLTNPDERQSNSCRVGTMRSNLDPRCDGNGTTCSAVLFTFSQNGLDYVFGQDGLVMNLWCGNTARSWHNISENWYINLEEFINPGEVCEEQTLTHTSVKNEMI